MSDVIKREIPSDLADASLEGRTRNKGKRIGQSTFSIFMLFSRSRQKISIANIANAKYLIRKRSLITTEGRQADVCVCACVCVCMCARGGEGRTELEGLICTTSSGRYNRRVSIIPARYMTHSASRDFPFDQSGPAEGS